MTDDNRPLYGRNLYAKRVVEFLYEAAVLVIVFGILDRYNEYRRAAAAYREYQTLAAGYAAIGKPLPDSIAEVEFPSYAEMIGYSATVVATSLLIFGVAFAFEHFRNRKLSTPDPD